VIRRRYQPLTVPFHTLQSLINPVRHFTDLFFELEKYDTQNIRWKLQLATIQDHHTISAQSRHKPSQFHDHVLARAPS
jgi:hypothetical protein